MRPILTAAEMRAVDAETIAAIGIPGAVLMETAGRALAREVRTIAQGAQPLSRVVVLCGAGNNGGDGFVAARVLAEWGFDVEVFLVLDPAGIGGDAKTFYDALVHCGVSNSAVLSRAQLDTATPNLLAAEVIVDAVFGTGLCRDVTGHIACLFALVAASDARVVAADIPSGLCADTGVALGSSIVADVTVAMGAAKIGNVCDPGFVANGRLTVAEIGIPSERIRSRAGVFLVENADVVAALPTHGARAHKASRGHVLAIAGSEGKRGAGRLAAMAALRSGAGLVTLGAQRLDSHVADPVMTTMIATPPDLAAAWARKAALLLGPGMDAGSEGAALVEYALDHSPIPIVLDADALNHLARTLAGSRLIRSSATAVVLTPHPGEAGRLLGIPTAQVQAGRIAAVRELASRTQSVVILKGARTCIADGRTRGLPVLLCEQGGPELATAGTGDVLAGMVSALLAQGLAAGMAAMVAVYWHGVAGRAARSQIGGLGVVATDVVAAIPTAHTIICEARLAV